MINQYIVTNFAYGTGPYLRTTELALAFNDELEKRGHARMPIIVPWVYGEKQRRIMQEEFGTREHEILLDEELGLLLKSIFYGDMTYAEALARWVNDAKVISEKAKKHLVGSLSLETLGGEKITVEKPDIALELNRSPRIRYNVAPSYMATFAYIAEILEHALKENRDTIAVPEELLKKGIETANWVEEAQNMRSVAYPATFSGSPNYRARYPDEIMTPPNTSQFPTKNTTAMQPGIFVTVTGIPGLERLYEEARELGLLLYSNDTEAVPGSVFALPESVTNDAMAFQFARSGWGSVWLSLFVGLPIVIPEYDKNDDPEIFFNNLMVEKLGLGIIYRGQPLTDILTQRGNITKNYEHMRENVTKRFSSFDGNRYAAKIFVDDFLKKSI